MGDPKRTLELLERLEALGYDDEVHQALHHMAGDTVESHRAYCRKTGRFTPDGNNERFQRRLALVLGAYEGGVFETRRRDVLLRLAKVACELVPAV